VADSLLAELATVGENILLPAVNERIKHLFGIDLSEHLFHHKAPAPRRISGKKSSRKGAAKKGAAKKKSSGKKSARKKSE
jgi:hypothetical protein